MHVLRWTGFVLGAVGCLGLCACRDKGSVKGAPDAGPPDGGSQPQISAPLPNIPRSLATVDDLVANDLRMVASKQINPTVARFDLARTGERYATTGGRAFRAKWKPLGPGGSEAQEGFDGNNSPRCEIAAWRLDRLLFHDFDPPPPKPEGNAPTPEPPYLVPRVIVRALHRDVPCNRACAGLPKLAKAETPPTFPDLNDHLVLGALTQWVEGTAMPKRFNGDLWNAERFAEDPAYKRSVADLMAFLYVIAHGDANNATNFLLRMPKLDRIYSIDNGRSLDGVPLYTDSADPEWQPLAQLSPSKLVVPQLARPTIGRLAELRAEQLQPELYLVAAVELSSGRAVVEPKDEPELATLRTRPLLGVPSLVRRSRQTYTGPVKPGGPQWLLLGVSDNGINQLVERAQKLVKQVKSAKTPLFD